MIRAGEAERDRLVIADGLDRRSGWLGPTVIESISGLSSSSSASDMKAFVSDTGVARMASRSALNLLVEMELAKSRMAPAAGPVSDGRASNEDNDEDDRRSSSNGSQRLSARSMIDV